MIRVQVGDVKIGQEERQAINEVLDSGQISEGQKVREFENKWAEYIGTKYAIALNSGTSALIAGLNALKYYPKLGIKPGSKIITSPVTYTATVNAIVLSGFEPVFVDINRETFGITPENIRKCLEQAEKPEEYSLVLPVHLMGYACDMEEINKIAKDYGLFVFEDSAEAHGTLYKGKKVGSLSLLSDFSFYIAHNIQAGELGAIVTDDPEIIRLIRKIKANGRLCDCPVCLRKEGKCPVLLANKDKEEDIDPRFTHDLIGYNFKTMEFQAALAVTQIKKADWINQRRRENVDYLNQGLSRFSGIFQLPEYNDNTSYIAYPLVIKNPKKISRKKLREDLEKEGVETRPLLGCIPAQQPAYSYLKEKYQGKLPNADFIGLNGLYIGCHQYLSKDDLNFTINAFEKILRGRL